MTQVSFPSHILAAAAKATHCYGYCERAYDAMRSPEAALDLLNAWAPLRELQVKLDFYFFGRPLEEPDLVLAARRHYFRSLRRELGL